MTARSDLHDALVGDDPRPQAADRANTLIGAAISEAIQTYNNVLHLQGRPAPAEPGYARDQLIVAFRGGEDSDLHAYGWDTAVMMADRIVASLRAEIRQEMVEEAHKDGCDCRPCGPYLVGFKQAVLRQAAEKDLVEQACTCGELTCPCGCQAGDEPTHWIHSRSCGTQKR